ncbi:hypothetical protein N9D31_00885 [Oligoflexaceae bacterium]|nr:hypothetical protein [Oligoflexaceae bacterium]
MSDDNKPKEDLLYISDDKGWIDAFVFNTLDSLKTKYVKLPSDLAIRKSWNRFGSAKHIVIHWEGRHRRGGAIIEEIIDVDRNFDVSSRIIVITTEPAREDVVYFGELGIKKIVRLRNNKRYFEQTHHLLHRLVAEGENPDHSSVKWRQTLKSLDDLNLESKSTLVDACEKSISNLRADENEDTARYFDAMGSIHFLKENFDGAKVCFTKALDQNSQYYRSYTNLIKLHIHQNELDSAMALCKKMQSLNKDNIARLVDMGEVYYLKGELDRSEHAFKQALERDSYCGKALNGLAQIHFDKDEIHKSRELLAKSDLAFVIARKLNQEGIVLVKEERYEEALEHYSKAQFVIPMQDKGPLLFFNIALCYSRWGKYEMAKEFLRIALIKDPKYEKAQKLFDFVDQKIKKSLQNQQSA